VSKANNEVCTTQLTQHKDNVAQTGKTQESRTTRSPVKSLSEEQKERQGNSERTQSQAED